jgi:ribosomal protein S27AE
MIFIFGFSPKEKIYGPVTERICPRCSNTRFWLLKSHENWFSLFFIPIIPVSKKHHIACPICGESEPVSAEDFQFFKKRADINNEALRSDMSGEAYEEHLKNL